jgi:DNA polymerase
MPVRTPRKPKPPPVFTGERADGASIAALHRQAEHCTRCDLYKYATQVVFGEGPPHAPVVLVGEQPGDREDEAGRPFVGPAGRLLDECLEQAGVDRGLCYVTNAVKHFKFERRGKRRLHARPNAGLIVALGATALYALMGRSVGLTQERGRIVKTVNGTPLLVTVHPSYLLRIRDRDEAQAARQAFVEDLERVASFLGEGEERNAPRVALE